MPRPRIGEQPMTARERAQRSRTARAGELQRLRDENAQLRALLDAAGINHGSISLDPHCCAAG